MKNLPINRPSGRYVMNVMCVIVSCCFCVFLYAIEFSTVLLELVSYCFYMLYVYFVVGIVSLFFVFYTSLSDCIACVVIL